MHYESTDLGGAMSKNARTNDAETTGYTVHRKRVVKCSQTITVVFRQEVQKLFLLAIILSNQTVI